MFFYFVACFDVFVYEVVISKCSKGNWVIDFIINEQAVAGE